MAHGGANAVVREAYYLPLEATQPINKRIPSGHADARTGYVIEDRYSLSSPYPSLLSEPAYCGLRSEANSTQSQFR